MNTVWLSLVTVLLVAAAGYAHYRIPHHTEGTAKVWIERIILILVGVTSGCLATRNHPGDTELVFLSAFGLMHLPAAMILLVKHQRASWDS